jgi:hypothetical protein
VAFSVNQKKQNGNPTPPRMALDRSILAITAGVSSPPKKKALANNPYHLLADQEDSDVCPPDSTSTEQAHELEKGGTIHKWGRFGTYKRSTVYTTKD